MISFNNLYGSGMFASSFSLFVCSFIIVIMEGRNYFVIVTCVKRSIKMTNDYFNNWASLDVNFSMNNNIFLLTFFLNDFVLSFSSFETALS